MKKIIVLSAIIVVALLLFLLSITTRVQAQGTDSLLTRIKVLEHKVVAARVCIFNMQDYVNLCKGKKVKNSVYIVGWMQRILTDYETSEGIVPQARKPPVRKKIIVKHH
jgi:hypothetical protein